MTQSNAHNLLIKDDISMLQKPVSLGMPFAMNFADFVSKNHLRCPSLGFELLKLVVVVEESKGLELVEAVDVVMVE